MAVIDRYESPILGRIQVCAVSTNPNKEGLSDSVIVGFHHDEISIFNHLKSPQMVSDLIETLKDVASQVWPRVNL